ncbi:MAG: tRNA lysidine(34) synthetase TilS [Christensenellaceae bacterium]|jgi:tRNA(Ile)-lysidine synthase|nr:tRNA lysidine(34) synthetase TilS [Christensenellaceae bacterium]
MRKLTIQYDKSKKIGVGVSGGIDSMVLLEILRRDGADIVVICIDHGIRGNQAKDDAKFVENYCINHNMPCIIREVDAPHYACTNKVSIELAARILRYEIFGELLSKKEVDVVALAHHANDQVETVLLRLFRGTGVRGLRGIVDREGYIHPLLEYTKDEIIQFSKSLALEYRQDETNFSNEYSRNFIRNTLFPQIESRFPMAFSALRRLSTNMAEVEEYLQSNTITPTLCDDLVSLPISVLTQHPVIAKMSIAEALRMINSEYDMDTVLYNYVLELRNSRNNTTIDLPHRLIAIRQYDKLVFKKRPHQQTDSTYCELFDVDEEYVIDGNKIYSLPVDCISVNTYDADKIPENAVIRKRRTGDKFTRFGGGTKSLSDYFTDIKLPTEQRDRQAVIALGNIIYAIPGLAISKLLTVDDKTKRIYKFYLEEHESI